MDLKNMTTALVVRRSKETPKQLITKWGESLINSGKTALTEYPRPQLKRHSYINLNGWWKYAITESRVRPIQYDGEIFVPFSPESYLSAVGKVLLPGAYLWYVRNLMVEAIPVEKKCILHFGAVDQFARIYVNHQFVGEHIGGYLPFSFEITDYLKTGENEICVMVRDDTDASFHSRGKQKLQHEGMYYTPQSGIWQTVWMEWVPKVYLKKLKIIPDLDKKCISIRMEYEKPIEKDMVSPESKLLKKRIVISTREGVILEAETDRNRLTLPIPEEQFHTWSPETPFLYRLVITCGKDKVRSYFAMRKIHIAKDSQGIPKVFLNNAPYFMNGVLDQGYWPEGLLTPPSDEAMISDITNMKALGFNTLRKHCKIEPARWYYHCDRIGMLVWQDIVNGGDAYHPSLVTYVPTLLRIANTSIKDKIYAVTSRQNQHGRKEWLAECRETVHCLSSFPSIIMWVLFNEGWGQFDSEKVYRMVKKIDPDRLIDHASGWFDQGCGDFKSEHNYFDAMQYKRDKRPYILSEYGGYACPMKGHIYNHNVYGYHRFDTQEDLKAAVRKLLEEVKRLKKEGMAGAIFTQVSDIEEEVNGILTYDRRINKWS